MSQLVLGWHHPCVFMPIGATAFQPAFHESETAVLSTLDAFVLAVAGIPKLGGQSTVSSSFAAPPPASAAAAMVYNPMAIPTTTLQEDVVQSTRKVMSICNVFQYCTALMHV